MSRLNASSDSDDKLAARLRLNRSEHIDLPPM